MSRNLMFGSTPNRGGAGALSHGRASGNDRMLVGFAVTGCYWPRVSSLGRSVT
jgi:hypothetical protein